MRVLVDTSVWSMALRRRGPADHPAVQKLIRLLARDEDLFLTGLILQEVLQGFRDEATVRRLARHLEAFPVLNLNRDDYVAAAQIHRSCAAKGVAASTADCQIAAAAIGHDCILLTADEDFARIAVHAPLRLL